MSDVVVPWGDHSRIFFMVVSTSPGTSAFPDKAPFLPEDLDREVELRRRHLCYHVFDHILIHA